tara:strand:+ start:9324 stop:9722 length:399 start_codon:yes stop_codon:yes gene_type:complete
MLNKQVLLASFMDSDKIEWFYGFLEGRVGLKRREVFLFKNLSEDDKFIMTYRHVINLDGKDNLVPNALQIHKKGNAIYTINGLNRLIEFENSDLLGNINHSTVSIDWTKYQNTIIMSDGGKLTINNLERVFS